MKKNHEKIIMGTSEKQNRVFKNSLILISAIVFSLALAACQNPFFPHYADNSASGRPSGAYTAGAIDPHTQYSTGSAIWARTAVSGIESTLFNSSAVDPNGYIFAAGWQSGTGAYTYGAESAAGASVWDNPVLVKYDPAGKTIWARTLANTSNPGDSGARYNSIAVDKSGNAIAAGYINGTISYTFGSKTIQGLIDSKNPLLVKYKPNGDVMWAKTLESGPDIGYMEFLSAAVDEEGNIYAVGNMAYRSDLDSHDFGNSVYTPAIGNAANTMAPILIKYNPDGNAQWARSIASISNDYDSATFYSVAVHQEGSKVFIYASGEQYGNNTSDQIAYGTAAASIINIACEHAQNPLLVKYDEEGSAIWARTFKYGYRAVFTSVAVDHGGNAFVAGWQHGDEDYNYGTSTAVNGGSQSSYDKWNPILVKYDSAGDTEWARSTSANPDSALFISVSLDNSGNVYAAGWQTGNARYDYGSGGESVNAEAVKAVDRSSIPVLVKYDTWGTALWAKTVNDITNDDSGSYPNGKFNFAAADRNGFVYAAGHQATREFFEYGDGSVSDTRQAGFSKNNMSTILVKYRQ